MKSRMVSGSMRARCSCSPLSSRQQRPFGVGLVRTHVEMDDADRMSMAVSGAPALPGAHLPDEPPQQPGLAGAVVQSRGWRSDSARPGSATAP